MIATASIAPYYEGWAQMQRELVRALRELTPEQLALPVGSPEWPIWASASHIAGARVYWFCHVFHEPGVETTPFTDPQVGWEDDLAHPRTAPELVHALESSWKIIERALHTWTAGSLTQTARRTRDARVQIHTRQSILWRLITHDAFHGGEISLVLGANHIGAIEMWSELARVEQ